MTTRDLPESRANVAESVPNFIVAGKTTRADVLIALGAPDGETEGGEQFVYTRSRSNGGVLFIFFAVGSGGVFPFDVEKMTYWRLVILFDETGVVRNARFEAASCTEYTSGNPCVDRAGRDLPRLDSGGASLSKELANGRVFATSVWFPGSRGLESERKSLSPPSIAANGSLVVGASSVLFLPPGGDKREAIFVKLTCDQIAEVYVDKPNFVPFNSWGPGKLLPLDRLVITRKTGTYETFAVESHKVGVQFVVNREATEAAAELIEACRKAAVPTPP